MRGWEALKRKKFSLMRKSLFQKESSMGRHAAGLWIMLPLGRRLPHIKPLCAVSCLK